VHDHAFRDNFHDGISVGGIPHGVRPPNVFQTHFGACRFAVRRLDQQRGQYDNGTQTSCILPLAFDLVPDDAREMIFDHLVDSIVNESHDHIGAGLIGGQYLMRLLTDNGRPDLAYTIATQKTHLSWGCMLEHGATIWELWNGNTADPGMNSHNHVMLVGDLETWLHEELAGIEPDPA
jgi:alpha-L-rhamnosidase